MCDNQPYPMTNPSGGHVELTLTVPFVVCASHGGPFDDAPFVAGFQAGMIHQALQTAGPEVDRTRWVVRTGLLRQVELIAMSAGFPTMTIDASDYPEWTLVTFARSRETADADG
jgi:hypothetical protein